MVTRVVSPPKVSAARALESPIVTAEHAAKYAADTAATSAQQLAGAVARQVQKNVARAVAGTLGLVGERMSKVDTAWLRMDCAANLMMIMGVWQLQPGVKHAAVCARIESTLLKYARFRQRVVEDAAGATWVDDRHFDLNNHVLLETLPKAATAFETKKRARATSQG